MTTAAASPLAAIRLPAWLARWMRGPVRPRVRRLHALAVAAGATRELPLPAGRVTIHCRQGELWLTRDGDPRDVILRASEHHVLDPAKGRYTAHALRGSGVVEIEWELPR